MIYYKFVSCYRSAACLFWVAPWLFWVEFDEDWVELNADDLYLSEFTSIVLIFIARYKAGIYLSWLLAYSNYSFSDLTCSLYFYVCYL